MIGSNTIHHHSWRGSKAVIGLLRAIFLRARRHALTGQAIFQPVELPCVRSRVSHRRRRNNVATPTQRNMVTSTRHARTKPARPAWHCSAARARRLCISGSGRERAGASECEADSLPCLRSSFKSFLILRCSTKLPPRLRRIATCKAAARVRRRGRAPKADGSRGLMGGPLPRESRPPLPSARSPSL